MTHNNHEDHMKLVVEYASQSHRHKRFYRQPEFRSWSVESALESEVSMGENGSCMMSVDDQAGSVVSTRM
jgi:hypothetical protein